MKDHFGGLHTGGRDWSAKLHIQILEWHRTNMSTLQSDEDGEIGAQGTAISDSIQVGLHVHKAEKIAQTNPFIASNRAYEVI
jgi:hypothetical protein